MLVDAHVHLNNDREGSPVPARENCRRLFANVDEHGVDHAIVITSYRVTPDRPGEDVVSLLTGDPRTTVVEGLRWRGEGPTLFEMETRVADGLVSGIKLYPGYEDYAVDDTSLEAVHRLAAKHDVPVVIHTGDTYSRSARVRQAHPLLVDEVAVEHPDVDYVLCHLGNPWLRDAADVSGLVLADEDEPVIRHAVEEGREAIPYLADPASKLMCGSDWPLCVMGPYLEFLDALELEDEQTEGLAWRTAADVFDIDVDGTAA